MRCVAPLLLLAALACGDAGCGDAGCREPWLARRQDASGAWCVGGKPDTGATGLCLLAFLGQGYTDRGSIKENRYAPCVRRGLRFLIESPGANARDEAIAALTLCEAYWMTRNPRYELPAKRALATLDGGEDPVARAFVVAALRSGRFAGFEVPEERLDRERAWLDGHGTGNPAATLFSRVLLATGDPRRDGRVRRAVELLSREEARDPLTWYFGTLGTFVVGGVHWKRWNEALREQVVATQRPDGSWQGDVVATALYVSCLGVYYRYDRVLGSDGGPVAPPTAPRGRSSLPTLASRIELGSGGALDLESVSAGVRVEGFRVRVRLLLRFFHDGDERDEGSFRLRLPDGASPHALSFGSAAEPAARADLARATVTPSRMKSARMVERARARHAYETITAERRDPALLDWDGDGVFTARVFPLEPHTLHQVEIGYDLDLPQDGAFELVLPETRRANDVRIDDEEFRGTTRRRFAHTCPVPAAMSGGGYTAVRVAADLPPDCTVEAATLAGCTDVLVAGGTVAARGEAAAGARLQLRLRSCDGTSTWSTELPAPVASSLTPRVYGEIAVARLEPFAAEGVGVPEAYARHFRVVRETCSLVMLDSEEDYGRFGIRARDDAGVVQRVPVSHWLEDRRHETPKQRLRRRMQTLGAPTDLLEHVPDSDFEDLPPGGGDADALARLCVERDRLRLALVYDALGTARRRDDLCARLLVTEREGFWFDHARDTLGVDRDDLVVVLCWDTAGADVDLHVVDPLGDVCNWRRPSPATGGRLAADRTDGFGPEVCRFARAEPGEYVIRVNYFRPAGTTRARVVAIGAGAIARAAVELAQRDQMVEALRITIPEQPAATAQGCR